MHSVLKLCETAEHWNSISFTLPDYVRWRSLKMHWPFNFYVQVLSISGSMLETVFKHLDLQRTLLCNYHLSSSYAVHIVQTTGENTQHTKQLSLYVSFPLSPLSYMLSSDCRRRFLWPPQWPPEGASAGVSCHRAALHSELSWCVAVDLLWNKYKWNVSSVMNHYSDGNHLMLIFRKLLY